MNRYGCIHTHEQVWIYRLHTAPRHYTLLSIFGNKTLGVTRDWGWRLERYGSIKHKGHFSSMENDFSAARMCFDLHKSSPTLFSWLYEEWATFCLLFVPNKSHCCRHGPFSISQCMNQYSGLITTWKSSIGFTVVKTIGCVWVANLFMLSHFTT